ncbi:MAG TPA: ABC transporter ATP-binding protein [Planctomycetota bacterium]|nr:ABC transporter ATP-binding protein [Planctomycetota bacterium]
MSDPLLRTEALYKFYGSGSARTAVLRELSLSVEAGRFVTVMGPSGSGKSTLLHMVSGLEPPSGGRVLLAGQDLWALSERRRTLLRRDLIGFVFQFYNLIPNLDVGQNLRLPLLIGARVQPAAARRRSEAPELVAAAADAGPDASAAAGPAAVATAAEPRAGDDSADEHLERLVALFKLEGKLKAYPHELSGGEMQRVSIARALVTRPAIVMADEPTGNISSSAGDEVMRLFRRSCDELGQTILLVTHNARDAACSDEVHFLKDGELHEAQRLERPRVTPAGIAGSLAALGI